MVDRSSHNAVHRIVRSVRTGICYKKKGVRETEFVRMTISCTYVHPLDKKSKRIEILSFSHFFIEERNRKEWKL